MAIDQNKSILDSVYLSDAASILSFSFIFHSIYLYLSSFSFSSFPRLFILFSLLLPLLLFSFAWLMSRYNPSPFVLCLFLIFSSTYVEKLSDQTGTEFIGMHNINIRVHVCVCVDECAGRVCVCA